MSGTNQHASTADQGRRLAEVLGCDVQPEAAGGESRTFRLVGTDDLVTVPLAWPDATEPAADLTRRTTLQERVADRVAVPVPRLVRLVPDAGLAVVRRLPGTRLIDVPRRLDPAVVRRVAATVGTLLAELHTWAPDAYEDVADVDDHSPAEWRDEAADLAVEVAAVLTDRQREDVRRFLDRPTPGPASELRLSHNDLGIEHVLVAPAGEVTGVIDWDDAAICDPAYDFGLLLRDLGPEALDVALTAYAEAGGSPVEYVERARFYARCTLLEDLAFGHSEGRSVYVDKSLAAWAWTFSPH